MDLMERKVIYLKIKNKNIKAICCMMISSIIFTTMNLFGKLSVGITPYQKAFTANMTALIIMSAIMFKTRTSCIGKRNNRKYLFIRGISGSISLLFSYYAIEHMMMADSTMLLKMGPVFAAIFAFFILKEKMTKMQIGFLVITFIGVLFIVKPTFSFSILPALCGILASVCSGIAFTMIRKIGDDEKSYTVIFYNLFFGTIMNLPFMFFNTENYIHNLPLIFMFFGGLCIAFGQIFLTMEFKNAPAATISMFDYVGLIVSAIYGIIIFHEFPDIFSLIGYAIILGTAFISFLYNRKRVN